MPNREVALQISNVSKDFKLPTDGSNELKRVVINWLKGVKGYKKQQVLDNISFNVYKGDFFGIVGRNGSGKSTLLKVISGIYPPNGGKVNIKGTLIPFIELGVGFNPELTGKENVYLNGAMLGFTSKQIDKMYHEIVEFAELEDFMDQKLKNYSSGMQVRLAFSVAIKAQGDILVLDEVLAVGDEAFQKKCHDYFVNAKNEGKTIVLVTHDMSAVREFCNRAIFINKGKIEASGNPNDVANKYSNLFRKEYIKKMQAETGKSPEELGLSVNNQLSLVNIAIAQETKSGDWEKTRDINFLTDYMISFNLVSNADYKNATVTVKIINKNGTIVSILSSAAIKKLHLKKGDNNIKFQINNILSQGDYTISVSVYGSGKELASIENALKFTVFGQNNWIYDSKSIVHPKFKVLI